MEPYRKFLKADLWQEWGDVTTDQREGLPPPPLQKPYPGDAELIDLVPHHHLALGQMHVVEAIERRRSRRTFLDQALTLEELSFLLWATQGIHRIIPNLQASLRTVPSAGGRHAFETYLLVSRVDGLAPGLYRYLPVEHKLYLLRAGGDLVARVHHACRDQYVDRSAVTFLWTAIPYRTEWRYSLMAHKAIALDAGHLCQNLYLAATAIGAGTCALAAYDQEALDRVLGVDGVDEFAIYAAPLGKVRLQEEETE